MHFATHAWCVLITFSSLLLLRDCAAVAPVVCFVVEVIAVEAVDVVVVVVVVVVAVLVVVVVATVVGLELHSLAEIE